MGTAPFTSEAYGGFEWKLRDGNLAGPNGGSMVLDVAKRLYDHLPLTTWARALFMDPDSYTKPARVRGGLPMPNPRRAVVFSRRTGLSRLFGRRAVRRLVASNWDHGIDPGYLKHGKHSNETGPHIHLKLGKRGKFKLTSTRPYLPDLSMRTIEKVMMVLGAYYVDGTLPTGGAA